MDPTPTQFIALCAIFIGVHVVALPAFVWAVRRGQFRGREQREWHLDDSDVYSDASSAALPAMSPRNAVKARWMVGVLGTLGVLMIASVFLVMFVALNATAHPATGKCPF